MMEENAYYHVYIWPSFNDSPPIEVYIDTSEEMAKARVFLFSMLGLQSDYSKEIIE